MLSHLAYKIRFAIVDPNTIFNMCGPDHAGPRQWDEEGLAERRKFAQIYIDKLNKENEFFIKLERSVLKDGFKNPILVNAGFVMPRKFDMLPPYMQDNPKEILFCHNNGGSRLWIATELNIKIPCIVSDFIGRFENEREITTKEEYLSCYNNPPRHVSFQDHGITVKGLPLIHLWQSSSI